MLAAPQASFHNAARPPAPCERSPGLFWHRDRHLFTPAPCNRWDCPRCADIKRGKWIARIHTATPQRFFTLTAIPRTQRALWLATKCLFKELRGRRGRTGYAWEYFLTCDLNPKGTGFHLHGLQRGDFVPQRRLSNLAAAYGFGRVADIGSIQNIGGVAGYVTRHLITRDLMIEPDIPGVRRVRYSRHFFPPHAGPSDAKDPARPHFVKCPHNSMREVQECIDIINRATETYYRGSSSHRGNLGPPQSPESVARGLIWMLDRRPAVAGLKAACRLIGINAPPAWATRAVRRGGVLVEERYPNPLSW